MPRPRKKIATLPDIFRMARVLGGRRYLVLDRLLQKSFAISHENAPATKNGVPTSQQLHSILCAAFHCFTFCVLPPFLATVFVFSVVVTWSRCFLFLVASKPDCRTFRLLEPIKGTSTIQSSKTAAIVVMSAAWVQKIHHHINLVQH